MRKLLNKIIERIKGEEYALSSSITARQLIFIACRRLTMLLRGSLTLCNKEGVFFRGPKVKLYYKSKIKLGKGVTIERGSFLDALSEEGITIGENSSIGKNTAIECTGSIKNLGKGIRVGKRVGLGANNFFGCAGGITIGNDTIIGNFVSFHSENHVFSSVEKCIKDQGVSHEGIIVGNDCWIGAKATILDGVSIEDGCVIAAGALLKRGNYKKYGIYGGVPAKLLKYRGK